MYCSRFSNPSWAAEPTVQCLWFLLGVVFLPQTKDWLRRIVYKSNLFINQLPFLLVAFIKIQTYIILVFFFIEKQGVTVRDTPKALIGLQQRIGTRVCNVHREKWFPGQLTTKQKATTFLKIGQAVLWRKRKLPVAFFCLCWSVCKWYGHEIRFLRFKYPPPFWDQRVVWERKLWKNKEASVP